MTQLKDANFNDIQALRDEQKKIIEEFHIFLTVGIYAVDNANSTKAAMREKINVICKAHEGVVNTHGYYIDLDEKLISFDVGVDFTILDREAFVVMIKNEVEEAYSGFQIYPVLDTYYSD